MDLFLNDKIILVTGGAITRALAREGAVPVVIGRNGEDNAAIPAEAGEGFAVTAELKRPGECKEALDKAMERFGKSDGLVNNAAVIVDEGLAPLYEKWIRTLPDPEKNWNP